MADTSKISNALFFLSYFVIVNTIAIILINGSPQLQTDKNLLIFAFFAGSTAIPLLFATILYFVEDIFGKKQYSIFEVYFHDPEKSLIKTLFGKVPQFFKSRFNLLWVSVFVALLIGLLSTISLGNIQYQLPANTFGVTSQIGQIFLAGENVASFETLIFQCILMGLFYGIARWIAKKNNGILVPLLILFSIVNTGISTFYHYARYGTNESALMSVFVLFLIFNILTILTGSIIPALIIHSLFNMTWKAKEIFAGNELSLIIGFIVAIVLWIGITFATLKYKKENPHATY